MINDNDDHDGDDNCNEINLLNTQEKRQTEKHE